MDFVVTGANRETGREVRLTIDARDYLDAEKQANELGVMVSGVIAATAPATAPPTTAGSLPAYTGPRCRYCSSPLVAKRVMDRRFMAMIYAMDAVIVLTSPMAPAFFPFSFLGVWLLAFVILVVVHVIYVVVRMKTPVLHHCVKCKAVMAPVSPTPPTAPTPPTPPTPPTQRRWLSRHRVTER